MEKESKCVSCNRRIKNQEGSTKFLCPKCGKTEIIRCSHCRQLASKYVCKECGFEGPN